MPIGRVAATAGGSGRGPVRAGQSRKAPERRDAARSAADSTGSTERRSPSPASPSQPGRSAETDGEVAVVVLTLDGTGVATVQDDVEQQHQLGGALTEGLHQSQHAEVMGHIRCVLCVLPPTPPHAEALLHR
ncbi:hypothetical protein JZ751_004412 [Albula glossodonta]|uniref:Uncharacterized protein n=1 Tax=Albula glossodonta TaxID=121402 RepID=A0A8T2MPJ8_9TELE|nr:hypothetical protein JZ751_004412 [Albula glossodonta]